MLLNKWFSKSCYSTLKDFFFNGFKMAYGWNLLTQRDIIMFQKYEIIYSLSINFKLKNLVTFYNFEILPIDI